MNSLRASLAILIALIPLAGACGAEFGISFTGDIIMHIPVKSCALRHDALDPVTKRSVNNRGFDFLFERIAPAFRTSHIVVGNMEFPICPPYTSEPKIFNCIPEVLPALKKAGFTMFTIANNHIFDQKAEGIVNTLSVVPAAGFDLLGVLPDETAARAGVIKSVNGIRVGFIAYTGITNFPLPKKQVGYHVNWLAADEKLAEDIAAIRPRVDFLVMVLHDGDEYDPLPVETDREQYRGYVARGVDLVIRHHAHVIQPVEEVMRGDRRCMIFYGLGNFIANQRTGLISTEAGDPVNTADGLLVRLGLSRGLFSDAIRARYELAPVTSRNVVNEETGIREIQTVLLTDEMTLLKNAYEAAKGKRKSELALEIAGLRKRYRQIVGRLFTYQRLDQLELPDGLD